MKLTIVTNCILRCDYCFVDKKRSNQKMTLETAKKSIDFFLRSEGKDKILKIYGGEPLLNFEVVKNVVPYAKKIAKKRGINLTFSLCTNAVLLGSEHIDFFKKNKFQLAISFDGGKKTHDKFRKFADGRGTFDIIKNNFQYLFRTVDKKDAAANMSIVPSEAINMVQNFKQILKVGFDTLNIEPIYGFKKWTGKNYQHFLKGMKRITSFIVTEISRDNFIFLTTINREIKYNTLSKLNQGVCLFHQFPEIYPDGKIGFSSFFLNLPEKMQTKYIVGNVVEEEIKDKYEKCSYSPKSQQCRICQESYFDIPDKSLSSQIVQVRNLLSIDLANQIRAKAKKEVLFKKYIQEAKKHICF